MRAIRRGRGFVLDGVKAWVEGAQDADYFLVSALSDEGPAQFLIAAQTPQVRVEALDSLDLGRRFGNVRFDGTKVSTDALVGDPGSVARAIERQLHIALVLQCAESAGAMARMFEFTLQWAFDRFSFGRPLASYQELKHRFAVMKLWLEASMAAVAGARRSVEEQQPEAAEFVSATKAYVGEQSVALGQDCVQMHGGIGVTWEHDVHLFLRRITQNWGLFGTPHEHRLRLASLSNAS
jgi:alkylation response protein AidB-like acyl-CoA dehydrogenase